VHHQNDFFNPWEWDFYDEHFLTFPCVYALLNDEMACIFLGNCGNLKVRMAAHHKKRHPVLFLFKPYKVIFETTRSAGAAYHRMLTIRKNPLYATPLFDMRIRDIQAARKRQRRS
jgi:hypothetical protein